jgi:hypothetical protein
MYSYLKYLQDGIYGDGVLFSALLQLYVESTAAAVT